VELHTAEYVLDLVGHGLGPEAVGVLAGRPMIAVALDGRTAETELARLVGSLPCILVGVDASAGRPEQIDAELDVMLSDRLEVPAPWVVCPQGVERRLANLAASIARAPAAAVTVAQTLRVGIRLTPEDALVLESLAYGLLQGGPEHARWLASRDHRGPAAPASPSPAAGAPVTVEREGSILTITFDRPGRRNAYDLATRDALIDALKVAVVDPTIGEVWLCGAGPVFCSGGDLDEFGTRADPVTAHQVRSTRSAAPWVMTIAARLTARLHGPCVGAGIELAAFASRVVAAPDTTIWLPELALGLLPGAGGTVSIPRRVGRARAAYLMLSGATLDVSEALRWGLVDRVE
jgi:hypothetical protein